MIAQYITEDEYKCSCCGALPFELESSQLYPYLFNMFDTIREEWGAPIPITSGFRCPKHNRAVGGEDLSIHLWGLALDPDFGSASEVIRAFALIEALYPELRLGCYTGEETFIHMDCGYLIAPLLSRKWIEGQRWYK